MAMRRIVYLYTNPARANLEDTIDKYPHFSSWQAFLDGYQEYTQMRIPRNSIVALPKRTLSLKDQEAFAAKLNEEGREECILTIDPDAWMHCFDELANKNPCEIKNCIYDRIRQEEQALRNARNGAVIGAHALKLQPVDKPYEPNRKGKRMICLSSHKFLRVVFIEWYRDHCKQAPIFCRCGPVRDWLAKLPPGLFTPGGMLRANLINTFVPTANTVTIYN